MTRQINACNWQAPEGLQPVHLDESTTIAVAAHGNSTTTRKCLEAILHSAKGTFELILIDDCSPDSKQIVEIFRRAALSHQNTKIFQACHQNLEYSGSVNLALSHGRGDYILFISNDIIITSYYLSTLLAAIRSNSNIGTARGSSNFVDNGLPSHNINPGKEPENTEEIQAESRLISDLYGLSYFDEPYLTGDAFATSRHLIDKIGTFDPLFYGYFADHDFGLRAKIAGFRTVLVPGAYAYHCKDSNFNYLDEQSRQTKMHRRWARVHENWARFKLKYNLPVDIEYPGMNSIPWSVLAHERFDGTKHFTRLRDYSQLRLAK